MPSPAICFIISPFRRIFRNCSRIAEGYIGIYLVGTIFVQFALGLNTFISGQGEAKIAMLSVLIGAVVNIVLDPVLIFLFGLGVQGAALATIISQAFSALCPCTGITMTCITLVMIDIVPTYRSPP